MGLRDRLVRGMDLSHLLRNRLDKTLRKVVYGQEAGTGQVTMKVGRNVMSFMEGKPTGSQVRFL